MSGEKREGKKIGPASPKVPELFYMDCPFHADKSGSFHITEKSIHCFACGRRWDRKKKDSRVGKKFGL